jgi:cytidylate kinase
VNPESTTAPVVTLDGPGGSGKGTVGQRMAARLGWHFLDSGALYRALALAVLERGGEEPGEAELAQLAEGLEVRFEPQPDGSPARVWLGTREVSEPLRGEDCARLASRLAALAPVRAALLHKQRVFRAPPGLVADGRDMGTTVFPDATLKIFLTASAEVRAERRYKQLKNKGFDVNLGQLLGEIRERDARDAGRGVSPLRPAGDAEVLDSSDLTIEEVVDAVLARLHQRLPRGGAGLSPARV